MILLFFRCNMASSPKRARSNTASHICQLCHKAYERADHLNRHLDSHRNERSFKCSKCSRGFNRRDLLLRHQAAHAHNSSLKRNAPDRSVERAIKACDACVVSKVKCDNDRPCQRCLQRNIECVVDEATDIPVFSADGLSDQQSSRPRQSSLFSTKSTDNSQNQSGNVEDSILFDASNFHQAQSNDPAVWNSTLIDSMLPFPPFFEQIMAPDFVANQSYSMPPDIFHMMPDDNWFPECPDIFGHDFAPTIDQALQSNVNEFTLRPEGEGPDEIDHNTTINDSAGERHAIFQRSPWLWKPEANSNAFSEHGSFPLDEGQVNLASSPHQQPLPQLVLQRDLSPRLRDRLFQLVVKTAESHISIPTFPSTECLNLLLKVGLTKRMETDVWIHPYTFDAETTRPELLIALIAAGCICFGIPSVSKTGLVLFELTRAALHKLVEDDNSMIRDLQYLQACMIWIEVTAFCGFKRKMEIGEHSLQPLVTALRRAGKFDRVAYEEISVFVKDDEQTLRSKWEAWVEVESYKRLAHHLFEHDMYSTHTKCRNPLISYAEMTLPLPACRELWLARSPEVWRMRLLSLDNESERRSVSIRDLLADANLLRYLPKHTDARLARALHAYGLSAQVWEYHQQAMVSTTSFTSDPDPSAKLCLQLQHKQLNQSLQQARQMLKGDLAVTILLHEFLVMSLHVDTDLITRFAGKCGEAEARRAYKDLQPWSRTKDARTAIVHAAQAVRIARTVPPYQLRGCDSFILYHAIMVLWTYSMMHQGAQRQDKDVETKRQDKSALVLLDEESNDRIAAFILLDSGQPCLSGSHHASQVGQDTSHVCDLRNPQAVMAMGVKVFEGNLPNETRQNLPQLIKCLCELLSELGSLIHS
ncbi:uncharacterized protein RCC_04129 [Ramularia collo-cygni]|uniref:Uncharacterized protein n=1 Tax=Ramularia collo-cygni TaxID=112498 RepID=A0A2D3UVR2_9PEZI|nr:uncharacterized protein RCC_04129 [Ramularia collo-cygni]CZT18285.1 uncharacterized protein RCC_04129 [Ramularia collo-cygni]